MRSSPSLNVYAQPPFGRDYTRPMREYDESVNSGGFEELDDFSFNCAAAVSSPVPADQIFHNGKIKPIFDHHQQQQHELEPPKSNLLAVEVVNTTTPAISKRKALRRLFSEDSQHHSSADVSSSEEFVVDSESASSELDSVPSDSYCVWEPKVEKGNSWSKRWRLRDLLTKNASNKESHSRSGTVNKNPSKVSNDDADVDGKAPQPQQARKRTTNGGGGSERGCSYQPYRPQSVGIFGSARH